MINGGVLFEPHFEQKLLIACGKNGLNGKIFGQHSSLISNAASQHWGPIKWGWTLKKDVIISSTQLGTSLTDVKHVVIESGPNLSKLGNNPPKLGNNPSKNWAFTIDMDNKEINIVEYKALELVIEKNLLEPDFFYALDCEWLIFLLSICIVYEQNW